MTIKKIQHNIFRTKQREGQQVHPAFIERKDATVPESSYSPIWDIIN